MRVVDAKGTVSEPFTGVPAVAANGQVGLLDLVLDPQFATNRRRRCPRAVIAPSSLTFYSGSLLPLWKKDAPRTAFGPDEMQP